MTLDELKEKISLMQVELFDLIESCSEHDGSELSMVHYIENKNGDMIKFYTTLGVCK